MIIIMRITLLRDAWTPGEKRKIKTTQDIGRFLL